MRTTEVQEMIALLVACWANTMVLAWMHTSFPLAFCETVPQALMQNVHNTPALHHRRTEIDIFYYLLKLYSRQ